jgi:hypothetical protein
LGLDIPPPPYSNGTYYGKLCEPTPDEIICYSVKSSNSLETVETSIVDSMTTNPNHNLQEKPILTNRNETAEKSTNEWLISLLPPFDQMRRIIDYAVAIPYSVELGVRVCVECLYNMPESGGLSLFSSNNMLYKIIVSTSPPCLFYKDPPLYDNVFYTKNNNLDKVCILLSCNIL